MSKPEWTKYRVRKNVFGKCKPLENIYHVSHIDTALNIVSAGKIKAGLVYDKSKLNKKRILVCWLSPNDWGGASGFRYGHIRFAFDWKKICEEMNSYWVEVIHYTPHAPRILLTDKNYSRRLDTYDPTTGDGPWLYDAENDEHHWNGEICLEIMIERDLSLSEVSEIDFVNHHPHFCCISNSCQERNFNRYEAGSKFIAGIVGQDLYYRRMPKFYEIEDNEKVVKHFFMNSCSFLWRSLLDADEFTGNLTSKSDKALSLARAVLNAYANSNYDKADKLASLYKSSTSLKKSCAKLIAETFKLPGWKELLPKSRKRSRRR